jgi:hypothetical protein
MEGSYEIRDDSDRNIGYLYEGKVITDKTFGHATYGCGDCCGNDDAYLLPDPMIGPMGSGGSYTVYGENSCTGQGTPKGGAYNWASSVQSVGTVNSSGYLTMISPGTTNVSTFIQLRTPGINNCPLQIYNPVAPGNVTPKITSISPPRGLIGNSLTVTINGSGFNASNLSVSAGSDIQVSINSSNAGQIQATFAIAVTANGGNHNVTVTAGGQPSSPANFYVQIPQTMIRDSSYGTNGLGSLVTITNGNVVDIYGNTLLSNECGVYRNIGYLLEDQESPAQMIQGNYTLFEHFTNYTTSVIGLTVPPDVNNPIAYAQTRLGDTQFFGTRAPTCPGSNDHEGFDQNLTVVLDSSHSYLLSIVNHIDRGYYSGTATANVTITHP